MLRLLMQPSFWTLRIGDHWARGNSNASTLGFLILLLLLLILFLILLLLLLLLLILRMPLTPDVERG